ncbi:MAG: YlxR family protein [Proteobacteria bacterium]|nr:YlxR family protein [Pseudomonadota bacterium]MBU1060865.1 YlxR family protein [Pseudomonadota bacterium]
MSKASKNVPVRTCVVCRKQVAKSGLQRFVWEPKTEVVALDKTQVMPGRGVYCCLEDACKQRFFTQKQRWKKAFRLL